MSITTYSGLLTELIRLIDGEDTSASDIPTGTLSQIVNMGERRIYREVRSRYNEKDFASVTVASNLAAIPSDLESTSIVHFGQSPLQPVSEEWLRDWLQTNPSGTTRFFAQAGSNLMFGPTVSDGTTVQGRYFYRISDLTDANAAGNSLFIKEPDLFVYAALAESGPYFGAEHMQRIPFWEGKYVAIRDRINEAKLRAAYSAGRLKIRPATTLMR